MLSAASGSAHRRFAPRARARGIFRVGTVSPAVVLYRRRDRHKAYAVRCPLHLPRYVIRRDAGRPDKGGRGGESFVSRFRLDSKSGAAKWILPCAVEFFYSPCSSHADTSCTSRFNRGSPRRADANNKDSGIIKAASGRKFSPR